MQKLNLSAKPARAPQTFKLLDTETILPDDYPVVFGYVYIVDGIFTRAWIPQDDVTVADLKRAGKKEIRRCDLFNHIGACLGDKVEP